MSRAGRLLLSTLLTALALGCPYDFDQDYEDCLAGGRCAIATDDAGQGTDSGVGGGGSGADASTQADGGVTPDAGMDAGAGADASVDGGAPDGGGGGDDAGLDGGFDAGGDADAGQTSKWRLVRSLAAGARNWGLTAIAPGHVWVGDQNGGVAQFIDGGWIVGYLNGQGGYLAVAEQSGTTCVLGQWGTGAARTRVFPSGRWDGGASYGTAEYHDRAFYGAWSTGQSIWIGGTDGYLKVLDGSLFRDAGRAFTGSEDIIDGWASAENNQWVLTNAPASNGSLWRYDDAGWGQVAQMPATGYALWGAAPDDIWVSGQGVFRIKAGVLTTLDAGANPGEGFNSVWASGPDDVFLASSRGEVLHWDGQRFERTPISPISLAAIHGTGPDDVWATDLDGGVWHYGP